MAPIGDWLDNSGWAQVLVQAEFATAGMADSLLKATHVMRTRRAHQITAPALTSCNTVPMTIIVFLA